MAIKTTTFDWDNLYCSNDYGVGTLGVDTSEQDVMVEVSYEEDRLNAAKAFLDSDVGLGFTALEFDCDVGFPENEGKLRSERIRVSRYGVQLVFFNDYTDDRFTTSLLGLESPTDASS